MDLNEYQSKAALTAIETTTEHMAFGLLEEAGEIAAVFKRVWRHDADYLNPDDTNGLGPVAYDKLEAELGDLLWYVAMLADNLGFSLNEIALYNLNKLQRRKAKDLIHGSGDDR
jgi:NTP pyrophosphatase (non-canonical NTP hydrolase)